MKELIGWGSALVLLPTFGIQTYRQWQGRHEPAPASALWFFILAFIGVTGQVIYSWMVGNWVYFVLNACLIVTNGLGLGIAIHRRMLKKRGDTPTEAPARPPSSQQSNVPGARAVS